jgi:hypothetical protein
LPQVRHRKNQIAKQGAGRYRTSIPTKHAEAVRRAAGIGVPFDRNDMVAAHLNNEPGMTFAASKIKMEDHAWRDGLRVVPTHSELIKLGLIDYHAAIVARGEKQLFSEIKPDSRGLFSGDPSAFFNDYFRDIGVKVDKSVNFHSFRHGIADAFRSAGYYDEQFNVLLGTPRRRRQGLMVS